MGRYSVWKRILSNCLLLPRYSIFSKIFVRWAYAYKPILPKKNSVTGSQWNSCVCKHNHLQVGTSYLQTVLKGHFDPPHAWAPLKVPKHEIFDPIFFTPFNAIMEEHSMWKRIFSNSLFLPQYSVFSKILVCRAYAYHLNTYTEHIHTICTRTLSIFQRIVCICSVYAYEKTHQILYWWYTYTKHTLMNGMRRLSIHLRIVCICSVYVYNL